MVRLSIWLSLVAIFNIFFCFFSPRENIQNTKTLEVRHFRMVRKWRPTVTGRAKHSYWESFFKQLWKEIWGFNGIWTHDLRDTGDEASPEAYIWFISYAHHLTHLGDNSAPTFFVCLFLFRSFVRPFICSSVRPFVRSFVRPSVRLFVRSSVSSFVLSSVRSFVRSLFVRPSVCLFVRPFVCSSVPLFFSMATTTTNKFYEKFSYHDWGEFEFAGFGGEDSLSFPVVLKKIKMSHWFTFSSMLTHTTWRRSSATEVLSNVSAVNRKPNDDSSHSLLIRFSKQRKNIVWVNVLFVLYMFFCVLMFYFRPIFVYLTATYFKTLNRFHSTKTVWPFKWKLLISSSHC